MIINILISIKKLSREAEINMHINISDLISRELFNYVFLEHE
jgi:hypothetical protein